MELFAAVFFFFANIIKLMQVMHRRQGSGGSYIGGQGLATVFLSFGKATNTGQELARREKLEAYSTVICFLFVAKIFSNTENIQKYFTRI